MFGTNPDNANPQDFERLKLVLSYTYRRVCVPAGRYLTKSAYSRFSNYPVHVHACMKVLFRASERSCSCALSDIGRLANFFEDTYLSNIYHGDFTMVKTSRPPFTRDILLASTLNAGRKEPVASQSNFTLESCSFQCVPARRKPA